jgi:hypothetical protein
MVERDEEDVFFVDPPLTAQRGEVSEALNQ